MKRRFALSALSFLPVFLAQDLARSDQTFPSQRRSFTACRYGESGVGCTHFEGYVVVPGRAGAPDAPSQAVARHDAVLSANRLYLRKDDDATP